VSDQTSLRVGTAPDSWGVWFPDDDTQVPWPRFLDEVAEAGYHWIELGPHGYLPTDPEQLRDELGARHLVVIPDLWRSDATEAVLEPRTLDEEQWRRLAAGHDRLGRAPLEEFGVHQQFHSHADSHIGTHAEVERFLEATDPQYTNLCLDTGHFVHYLGDNLKIADLDPEVFAIVEQDTYPVASLGAPLPIATRTREHVLASTDRARTE
jgi:inosose dehydratase